MSRTAVSRTPGAPAADRADRGRWRGSPGTTRRIRPRAAKFERAVFIGTTSFDQAVLGGVTFDGARFEANAFFGHTRFATVAQFIETRFDGDAWFLGAEFASHVWFDQAAFAGHAQFSSAATFACFARMHDVWANPYQRSGQYEPSWPPGWLVDVDGGGNSWARVVPAPTVLL